MHLSFHDAPAAFSSGSDTPRRYLERCLEVVAAKEDHIRGFATLDAEGARRRADEASERWSAGRPLSTLDGMPIGLKDLVEMKGVLTEGHSRAFRGYVPTRDAACVVGLSALGVNIIGKTTTCELGGGEAPATTNPVDARRTPGGSSTGSAAVVGAGMVPAALGSQLKGSLLRPASFCGVFAFKPTVGAINRGGGINAATSAGTFGTIAGSLEDCWTLTRLLSEAAGPDAGARPLTGEAACPEGRLPARVGVLMPSGGTDLSAELREGFDALLEDLRVQGVAVLHGGDCAPLAELEANCGRYDRCHSQLSRYEGRWPLREYLRDGLLSDELARLATSEDWMTAADYAAALDIRDEARALYRRCLDDVDLLVTLTVGGPAPLGKVETGDRSYQVPASFIGSPAYSLPLLAEGGLPVGLQTLGAIAGDRRLTMHSRAIVARHRATGRTSP